MGDGNINWKSEDNIKSVREQNKVQQTSENKSEQLNTSQSPKNEDGITSEKCNKPATILPLELEELHRNTNNNVNTPDISSASIEGLKEATPNTTPRRRYTRAGALNEYGLPMGPAAGLGPQEDLETETNNAIFSVRGTRSFKINRHRDSVSVFPSGCMGIKDEDEKEHEATPIPTEIAPTIIETPPPISETEQSLSPKVSLRRPNSAARNPLTGEGYEKIDAIKQNSRKPDGNPVLGQGYDNDKNIRTSKVPPGGYSKGLW